jgi:hypothetical protein
MGDFGAVRRVHFEAHLTRRISGPNIKVLIIKGSPLVILRIKEPQVLVYAFERFHSTR